MRINRADTIFQVYNKNQGVKKTKTEKKPSGSDEVKLSDKAIDFQHALRAFKEIEEFRTEKADLLKDQVQSGNYNVDGERLADKMLADIFTGRS